MIPFEIIADAGVPMIFIQWPLMLAALIPVIVIEALLIKRCVPLSNREAFWGIAKANFISTLVGVPLAWLAMFAIEIATMFSMIAAGKTWHWKIESPLTKWVELLLGCAWLGPQVVLWQVAAAAGLLLIPSFYVSVWIERWICLRAWPAADRALVRRGVFLSNLGSYALLFFCAIGWMIYAIATQPKPAAGRSPSSYSGLLNSDRTLKLELSASSALR